MPTDEPDTDEILAGLVALVRRLNPTASRIRVVYDCVDGVQGVMPVSVVAVQPTVETSEVDTLAQQIVDVLSTLRPGSWLSGASLASEIDEALDKESGTFRRAIKQLRDSGRVESHPRSGYRLTENRKD